MEVLGKGLRPGMPGASGGTSYLKGLEAVMARLNKELEGMRVNTVEGMKNALAFIREQTEHKEPFTPVDLGNLHASWFVATAKSIPQTKGPKTFRGDKAGKYKEQFETAKTEGQAEVKAMSSKNKQFVMGGYGVNYAGFVHEFVGDVRFKKAGANVKWLQTHVYRNTKKIVEIIREEAQIKG